MKKLLPIVARPGSGARRSAHDDGEGDDDPTIDDPGWWILELQERVLSESRRRFDAWLPAHEASVPLRASTTNE